MIIDLRQVKTYWHGGIKAGRKEKYNKDINEICRIHKDPVTGVDNVMNMWKNTKSSFDLIDENYDLIIKSRYNLIFSEKIDLNKIKKGHINIPIG